MGDAALHERPVPPSPTCPCWKRPRRWRRQRRRAHRVQVEQDSEIGAARVSDELVRDSRSMITGFLEDDLMKSTAGRRKDLRGILARWAWVPLAHREAVLVMHEVAVAFWRVPCPLGLGCAKRTIGRT